MSEIIHAQNIIVRVTESYPHIGCPSRQKTIRVGIQVESIDFIPVFGVYLGRYPKPFWSGKFLSFSPLYRLSEVKSIQVEA